MMVITENDVNFNIEREGQNRTNPNFFMLLPPLLRCFSFVDYYYYDFLFTWMRLLQRKKNLFFPYHSSLIVGKNQFCIEFQCTFNNFLRVIL